MTAPAIGRPYVAERQVEYWSSRQVEDFFWDLGYECLSFPISQKAEQLIPADFIFQPNDTLKLFGLQYKVLYRGNPDYWQIDAVQRLQVAKFSWIYYALSDLRAARDLRAALHAMRIAAPAPSPGNLAISKFTPPAYMRWWAFFEQLRTCQAGLRVRTRDEFSDAFRPVIDSPLARREADNAADVLLLSTGLSRVLRFTTQMPDFER